MPQRVIGPDGRTWQVCRRWLPRLGGRSVEERFRGRLRRTAGRGGDALDVGDGCLSFDGDNPLAWLTVVVGVALMLLVALPLLVAILDVALVLVASALGVAAKVVFRRPWLVEATSSDGQGYTWLVAGLRASAAHRASVARSLGSGVVPPGAEPRV